LQNGYVGFSELRRVAEQLQNGCRTVVERLCWFLRVAEQLQNGSRTGCTTTWNSWCQN